LQCWRKPATRRYKTLDDIIDLEREDFLRLAGIAPEEADRLMTIINELTTEEGDGVSDDAARAEIPEPPAKGNDTPAESGTVGSDGGAGDATNANETGRNSKSDAGDVPKAEPGERKGS